MQLFVSFVVFNPFKTQKRFMSNKQCSVLVILVILGFSFDLISQEGKVKGKVIEENNQPVSYASVVLYNALDTSIVKAETTDENGLFTFENIKRGSYFAEIGFIGYTDYKTSVFNLEGVLHTIDAIMMTKGLQLEEVTISAQRAIVEVKADRTVFNVQGTINTTGDNGLNLLRKAPGVLVDNNNNISVLGRAGVLIYVDGKRIPLSGDDLSNYLQNLTAEQIDKIDIISNPGAKYEAQGNAGIIDIRLKKDKNLGANGSVSGTYGHGRYGQGNLNANGNYRNKRMNTFGSLGYNQGIRWNEMIFDTYQNKIRLDETNRSTADYNGFDGRWGTDFFISKMHTIGFLVSGQQNFSTGLSNNKTLISPESNPTKIDSILSAPNTSEADRKQMTFNINYAFESGKHRVNVDADYGRFRNFSDHYQPNFYFNPSETDVVSERINSYETPVDIDIATFKADYETKLWGGSLGAGTKYSNVTTDNTFRFFNIENNIETQNNRRSNQFLYKENVWAGYGNYSRNLNAKWNASAGLRVEHTDAVGELIAFVPDLEEDPTTFNYVSFFPSAGLTYQYKPEHAFALNYGRRINRPDYNVLNPFREQLSELSYATGNKALAPEIVNNVELGYTLKYRYSFKLAYSLTKDQITRLIGPDEIDPRAGFISWDNLATQKLYSANISLPVDITKWWNAYMNFSASYTDNQADYGDGKIVDLQAGSYSFFQQHTFNLGKKWKGEISGWYSGPGVWGGVFLYDPSYSLNFGLQRRFLSDKLNVRVSANDVTYHSGWSGVSRFNGQVGVGQGAASVFHTTWEIKTSNPEKDLQA